MSWLEISRVVEILAALAVIIAAVARYGESIGTLVKKMVGQRWPDWATHVSYAAVIITDFHGMYTA